MQPTTSVIDISFENAQQVLIEGSMNLPVVVHFWSPSSPQCEPLFSLLQQIHQQTGASFTLARVNMDELAPLAQQLGVAQAPAVVILKEGRPVDGFADIPSPEQVTETIVRHLPAPEEQLLAKAKELLAEDQSVEALNVIREAHNLAPQRNDIILVLIRALLNNQIADEAETLLNSLPLEDQQADFHELKSQLELLKAAAESPEIKALESKLNTADDSAELRLSLAIQYSQAGRNQEALELLLAILQKDLECLDGQIKKNFLDMLATLNGDPLSSQYRRKYFSILY
ncbi:tetratricopeptide repeat protein [Agarivorans sp. B2Z047]|uniref:tetratricopeptide repeat protein n=1 Tax=Agarivorans sp. B2Z047 TaxID=2652721 RepID=UPI00128C0314|nr:tetratricopeptide repeat protein [Agarivorans sp. B2Z047]MPW31095.1 tetratricopeptide repeat protein [Agarivorans sp. B2Z047]UQN40677.1 tetratricopeptide repeat protein [Agarivorans sp. B2Z047]